MWSKVGYWIFVLMFQFLVLNHLDISSFLVPQVFIVTLITLPLHINKNASILIAFAVGLLADLFVHTPGIHASACLWLMLIRIYIISRQDVNQQVSNRLPYDMGSVGLLRFIYTASFLTFFYHAYVIWLQNIGGLWWSSYLPTVLVSSVLSITIIIILHYAILYKR